MSKKKTSILFLDGSKESITLLYDKNKEIALAVMFDYGQQTLEEDYDKAKYHCDNLGVELQAVDMENFIFKLSQDCETEEDSDMYNYIPFGDTINLSILSSLAYSRKLTKILYANRQDEKTLKKIVSLNTNKQIKLVMPYSKNTKEEIDSIGMACGIHFDRKS